MLCHFLLLELEHMLTCDQLLLTLLYFAIGPNMRDKMKTVTSEWVFSSSTDANKASSEC